MEEVNISLFRWFWPCLRRYSWIYLYYWTSSFVFSVFN